MGIFRKIGDWLTDKSDRFVRGDAPAYAGYYGTQEAERSYAQMGARQEDDVEAAEQEHVGVDPFGYGEDEYGGRVPYKSRYDRERDAYEAAQQAAQQTARSAAPPVQPFQQARQAPGAMPIGGAMQNAQGAEQQDMHRMQQQAAMPQQMPNTQPYMQGMPQAMPQSAQPQPPQQAYPYAAQGPGNVVPFPGMRNGTDGAYYAHVEYVVSIHSRSECQTVIAYMKSNASVFLNMEFIASDSDRQRCVDLLSGAAYTLGCKLNKISTRGIYLISSPTVQVVLDPSTQRLAPEAQSFARQRYDAEGYGGYPTQRQETARGVPMTGFSSGSPTTRFMSQGAQLNPAASFGSVMAGDGHTQTYSTQNYPAQGQ